MHKKIILAVVLIIVISVACGGYYFAKKTVLPPSAGEEKFVEVKIKSGSTLTDIANLLFEKGVIQNVDDFIFTAKLFKLSDKLKAGQYVLPVNLSNYQLLKMLETGKVTALKVVIPEGYISWQIAGLLQKKIEIDSTEFMTLVSDSAFIKSLEIESTSLEGYLYPNTYFFTWGMSARQVIQKLVAEFHKNYNDSLKQQTKNMGWTIHEIVTLASIIEGEAMVDSERVMISAVYHNRLKKNMRLQADPTIQFIIPDGPRRLLNKDLAIDSPYNTYKYGGLPPGPVNNPGINSIIAAINPADVPYIYFVAKGDGSHIFSKTWRQHLNAKRNFDKVRREVRRKANANKS
ncbi:endolytic transglycosylase MltG [candidate division KSB1 bacterium]|nr:endolytic transglycosylase MltG [candidate division KSB1 bacterium]